MEFWNFIIFHLFVNFLQMLSENHRIIEWFGLEGTFKVHLEQLLCNKQGHFQRDQVSQSPFQSELECFQGWGIYYLPAQPALTPVLPSFSLKSPPLVPLLQALLKSFSPSFF